MRFLIHRPPPERESPFLVIPTRRTGECWRLTSFSSLVSFDWNSPRFLARCSRHSIFALLHSSSVKASLACTTEVMRMTFIPAGCRAGWNEQLKIESPALYGHKWEDGCKYLCRRFMQRTGASSWARAYRHIEWERQARSLNFGEFRGEGKKREIRKAIKRTHL